MDSIEALSAAADRLTEACEARIHASPEIQRIDPAHPARAGIAKALRTSFRELSTTPADMAVQLIKLDGRKK